MWTFLTSGFRPGLARRRRSNEKVPLTWKNRTCLGTYQPRVEGTFPVTDSARTARVMVSADGRGLVSQAGAVLLWETLRVTGLGRGLSQALEPWRGRAGGGGAAADVGGVARRWGRSGPQGPLPGSGPGHWPGTPRPARTAARSSSTWTPPS